MGYNVSIQSSTFKIPAENLGVAYEKMCKLNYTTHKNEKRGGCWPGKDTAPDYEPHQSVWFSWLDWNYDQVCNDAKDILEALGFDCEYDEDGNLYVQSYDQKTGQEEMFLSSICSVSSGRIFWIGEDGSMWIEDYDNDSPKVFNINPNQIMDLVCNNDGHQSDMPKN